MVANVACQFRAYSNARLGFVKGKEWESMNNMGIMKRHGEAWKHMKRHGPARESKEKHGKAWGSMQKHENAWKSMGKHENVWKSKYGEVSKNSNQQAARLGTWITYP